MAGVGALAVIALIVIFLVSRSSGDNVAAQAANSTTSTALLPRDMLHEPGVLALLYALPLGFERLMASPVALGALQGLTALLLLLGLLGARTRAVLRRTTPNPAEEVLKMGEVELNLTSYTLKVKGKEVPLTSKELDLLYVFLSSPNRVLSRPYLIERVWGYNYFGSPRTVDVHVRRLREKLGKAARFIHTVPAVNRPAPTLVHSTAATAAAATTPVAGTHCVQRIVRPPSAACSSASCRLRLSVDRVETL